MKQLALDAMVLDEPRYIMKVAEDHWILVLPDQSVGYATREEAVTAFQLWWTATHNSG